MRIQIALVLITLIAASLVTAGARAVPHPSECAPYALAVSVLRTSLWHDATT